MTSALAKQIFTPVHFFPYEKEVATSQKPEASKKTDENNFDS